MQDMAEVTFILQIRYKTMHTRLELYIISDREILYPCALQMGIQNGLHLFLENFFQRSLYVSPKTSVWLLEDHDEHVAEQQYPRYLRWATCQQNVQVWEASSSFE